MIDIKINSKNATVKFAKQELESYLVKINNKALTKLTFPRYTLEVVEQSGNDRVDIISDSEAVVKITANNNVALLIGVYQYLHILGARFLRPGKDNDFLPKLVQADIDRQISYSHTASYKHRGVCIEGADSLENVLEFIDWLPKNGFNSFFIQFDNPYTFLKRWYSHEFNNYWENKDFSTELAKEMSNKVDEAIKVRSLHHHRVGHGWTGRVLGFSSEFGWETGKKISEDKKGLVALVNGKRELINDTPIFTSLDFANPEVNKRMAKIIVDYAKKHSEVDYLHVWLSDANNNICECSECQKTTPSDQYVEFLNYLDEQLTKAELDTKICFLLYHELLYAPEKAKIKHPDRFIMMFAPISRTFEKSYADVDYKNDIPEPPKYKRNNITLPNSLESNLAFLFDWQKMFAGDSFVYDYPLGRAHYGDLGYMEISHVISRDIKYLEQLHLNGYISCQELRAGLPTTFPNYVMGRTLWDKEISYEDLVKEYFSAAFGNEYQDVIHYLDTISNLSSPDYFNGIGNRINKEISKNYHQIYNLANEFLDTVIVHLSKSKGVQHENWKILAYHREVLMQLSKALELISNGNSEKAEDAWKNFIDFIKLHEDDFQFPLDVYRITEVATNYAGFKYRDK
ncbi:hypothetical protein J2Z60_000756 [Lactobacillus colini]|uniref:DUF4838 domain-containing protein n=1 Tax=Lactobacillus colini TaxID=1819254 RepID=A0ABS4MD24_9LACO|nr:DUF4838 domain-containing protein [Lactobacillus colini]MBP2057585.1 hypothetical protein [Lactobacillus colini]